MTDTREIAHDVAELFSLPDKVAPARKRCSQCRVWWGEGSMR